MNGLVPRLFNATFVKGFRRVPVQKLADQRAFFSSDAEVDFEQAKQTLNLLKNEPDNDVKLQIYALFKQATQGENKTEQPPTFNFVAKFKWDAWKSLGSMSKDEAKKKYVEMVMKLKKAEE